MESASGPSVTETEPTGSAPQPAVRPQPAAVAQRLAPKLGLGAVVLALAVGAFVWYRSGDKPVGAASDTGTAAPKAVKPAGAAGEIALDEEQRRSIALRTAPVRSGSMHEVLYAPGRVAPDEAQYAYITPRAAGVVRSVTARIGQDVKAGDLLALIDSPEVGQARLELYTSRQDLDIARTQAEWQANVLSGTLELLERLRKGESPQKIHDAFESRPVGENRERLLTAYAQYRLGVATMDRNKELYNQKLTTTKQFEQVRADYEVSQATYQSLMDQMGFETKLANTRAQQALKKAETQVRTAEERLRILGVRPETLEARLSGDPTADIDLIREAGAPSDAPTPAAGEKTVSTYAIRAPFDGTILDRELIVPGVAVDTTHRIFTMANLATVWVEASIHESDFESLARSKGAGVEFHTLAYPGRKFRGKVIYSGDLVEEKSRTVRLLALAENPDRLLKPGMFVEVQVESPRDEPALSVPTAALLTQGDRTFVYVKTGDGSFARREVEVEPAHGDSSVVLKGLEADEEVVVQGGSKLKALAVQLASSDDR